MTIQLISSALLLSLVPFAFTLLLDICLGKPAAEKFDRKAIFFPYSLFLAKLKLNKAGIYKQLRDSFITNMNSKDFQIRFLARMNFKNEVFNQGREFFTWELGFGMCPYCTNVRVSLLAAAAYIHFYSGDLLTLLLFPCFSNMYLLFFNKLNFTNGNN